jgi:hypothetical protein
MAKELIIKITKATLVLTENELLFGLRPDILEKAIRRGMGYRRTETVERRQATIKEKVI